MKNRIKDGKGSLKIITRIHGGIGNQLFCYAAARRLAIVNNAELVIDDVSGFVRDHLYQRHYQLGHFNIHCRTATPSERLEPFPRVRHYIKRTLNRYRAFERRSYITQEYKDFDARLLMVKPHGTLYLRGYWQSENYFKDVQATIRDDLHIIPPIDASNLMMAERICHCQSVALHMRFFDFNQQQGVNNASGDYYMRAIGKMESISPNAHYFIFSDQPEAINGRLNLPDDRITLVVHNRGETNSFADLWLMTQCKHIITANSTFSWWGAWLNTHPTKQVIAPGFQMREGIMDWGFEGLLPAEWIKV